MHFNYNENHLPSNILEYFNRIGNILRPFTGTDSQQFQEILKNYLLRGSATQLNALLETVKMVLNKQPCIALQVFDRTEAIIDCLDQISDHAAASQEFKRDLIDLSLGIFKAIPSYPQYEEDVIRLKDGALRIAIKLSANASMAQLSQIIDGFEDFFNLNLDNKEKSNYAIEQVERFATEMEKRTFPSDELPDWNQFMTRFVEVVLMRGKNHCNAYPITGLRAWVKLFNPSQRAFIKDHILNVYQNENIENSEYYEQHANLFGQYLEKMQSQELNSFIPNFLRILEGFKGRYSGEFHHLCEVALERMFIRCLPQANHENFRAMEGFIHKNLYMRYTTQWIYLEVTFFDRCIQRQNSLRPFSHPGEFKRFVDDCYAMNEGFGDHLIGACAKYVDGSNFDYMMTLLTQRLNHPDNPAIREHAVHTLRMCSKDAGTGKLNNMVQKIAEVQTPEAQILLEEIEKSLKDKRDIASRYNLI